MNSISPQLTHVPVRLRGEWPKPDFSQMEEYWDIVDYEKEQADGSGSGGNMGAGKSGKEGMGSQKPGDS